jgi:hypothetical protein
VGLGLSHESRKRPHDCHGENDEDDRRRRRRRGGFLVMKAPEASRSARAHGTSRRRAYCSRTRLDRKPLAVPDLGVEDGDIKEIDAEIGEDHDEGTTDVDSPG